MRLEPSERETIILFSDADDTASVYTFDKKLKARLKELHRRQPDKIYPDSNGRSGSVCFIVALLCRAQPNGNRSFNQGLGESFPNKQQGDFQ